MARKQRGFLSGKRRLIESPSKWNCESCGLYKELDTRSPKMEPYGKFRKGVMCIGEAPGKTEDIEGKPWQGKVGKFLQGMFRELGHDLFEDCISLNAINCIPWGKDDKTRAPSDHEITCCRDVKVTTAIEKYKPKVIILFGSSALQSVVGDKWKEAMEGISRWRGFAIPDHELGAWICPVYHPSFVVRKDSDLIEGIFSDDIRNAMKYVDRPLPDPVEPEIQYVMDGDVGKKLREFVYSGDSDLIAFDYETTGIKPHAEGHRIVCAAVARNEVEVMAVMFPRDNDSRVLNGFRDILLDPKIGKMAHNMKFEQTWTKHCLGVTVDEWEWDSMLAAHILDNRRKITGLKFQTYVNFGVVDYNANVDGYLKADNSNAFNRLDRLVRTERGRTELLKYCARDAVFTYNLALHQMKYEDADFRESYGLFHDGILALQSAEDVGIGIDVDYCLRTADELTDEVAEIKKQFEQTDLWEKWYGKYRSKSNLNSSTQLGDILYNVMGIEPYKETATGKGSTDQEALEQLDMDSLNLILEMRKIIKMRDTYILGWQEEEVNGRIRASFDLSGPTTYRSACSNPNLQNVPKRDEKAYTVCRSGIYPREGNQFFEVDYSGVETRIAAAITGDERLEYDAIEGDMHLDTAVEIFRLDSLDRKHKGEAMLRQAAKAFVFGQFYGGRAVDAIPILLDQVKGATLKNGTDIYDHLEDLDLVRFDHKGKVLSSFGWETHLEEVEDRFWTVRYKTYDRWKTRNWREYGKKGYIRFPTGFYYSGEASRNETLNAIIQGSAFHVLLWSFIELDKIIQESLWDTRLVGQIHDAILLDVKPSELGQVAETVRRVMEDDVRRAWKWITVDLEVEAELFEVDGPWVNGKSYDFKR